MPLTREQFVEQAMAEYESPLIGYATSILNDHDLARDVVQDTFIRLCHQDVSKVEDHLKSWLFTVCRNRALDHLRKNKRTQTLDDHQWRKVPSTDPQPGQETFDDDRHSRVMKILSRLTEDQRNVILLKFQKGLSYQEIEKATGLTSGNIGYLIHVGLKRVRELLPPDLR